MVAGKAQPAPATRPVSAPVRRTNGIVQMTCADKAGVTNKKYWDLAAKEWDGIQDTIVTDSYGVIRRALARHMRASDVCIDFGCGGGRYLQFLRRHCRQVIGLDISDALIELAKREVTLHRLTNVELRVEDLGSNGVVARVGPTLPTCTFAVCTNVLLSPEPTTRRNILELIADRLAPGGKLGLAPATEAS